MEREKEGGESKRVAASTGVNAKKDDQKVSLPLLFVFKKSFEYYRRNTKCKQ